MTKIAVFFERSEDMCALRESLWDIGRIGVYALFFIIIIVVIIIYYLLLLFRILYCGPLSQKKKEERSQH